MIRKIMTVYQCVVYVFGPAKSLRQDLSDWDRRSQGSATKLTTGKSDNMLLYNKLCQMVGFNSFFVVLKFVSKLI